MKLPPPRPISEGDLNVRQIRLTKIGGSLNRPTTGMVRSGLCCAIELGLPTQANDGTVEREHVCCAFNWTNLQAARSEKYSLVARQKLQCENEP
jgi:hypothetical protein